MLYDSFTTVARMSYDCVTLIAHGDENAVCFYLTVVSCHMILPQSVQMTYYFAQQFNYIFALE